MNKSRLLLLVLIAGLPAALLSQQPAEMQAAKVPLGPEKPKPVADIRRVDGTNYHVHVLKQWLAGEINGNRPLIGWRQVDGKIQGFRNWMLVVESEEPVNSRLGADPLPRIEGFGQPAIQNSGKGQRETPRDLGRIFYLTNYPLGLDRTIGTRVRCLAMKVGTLSIDSGDGTSETRVLLDYGLNAFSAKLPKPQPISWSRAIEMIRSGNVVHVSQWHSLDVILITKDQRWYSTKETRIDEVLVVVKEQAPNAQEIGMGTE